PLLLSVLDTSAQYPHAVKPSSVALPMPAEVILGAKPCQGARRLQRLPQPVLQLLLEPLRAPSLDNVLQSRAAPITAIAAVAVNRSHVLSLRQSLIRPQERNRVGEGRMPGIHAVTLSEASTREYCEACEHATIEVGDEAEIVAVDIRRVVTLVSETDFEFA